MQNEIMHENTIDKPDWQRVEALNDLLFGEADVLTGLQKGLSFVLDAFGYSTGALMIRHSLDTQSQLWLYHNLSLDWQGQLSDPNSQLNQIASQVMGAGVSFSADPDLYLAAAFPLLYRGEVVGGLLISGSEFACSQPVTWRLFLHALARAIHSVGSERSTALLREDLRSVEAVFAAQCDVPKDANTVQHVVLEKARELFRAEDALLILLEEGSSSLVFQKQLGLDGQWVERRVLIPEELLESESFRNALWNGEDLQSAPEFVAWLDVVAETNVQRVIGTPLRGRGDVTGALIIINPMRGSADSVLTDMLQLLSSFLSIAIENSREITGLKIATADLEANRWEIINSRNTLLTFFDSIPASVYIIDRYYGLISINMRRALRENKHPSSLVGKRCYEVLYNRSDPCPACRAMETFNTSAITTRLSRQWIDQDRFLEWEITTFPIQDEGRPPHRVIVFEEDVTEKRNLEANLIQSEKLASVGQLAAGVAHEINNPLAAVIANAQMLKRSLPKDDEDMLDSVNLIEMAGARAAQVVSNLLSLSRKEKKDEFELISLNETIQNALSLVHHEIVNRGIQVNLDMEEDMPEIMASKNHLQGVWINMIVNSLDAFTREDEGVISISSRYANNEFRVVISDSGKGIPEDHLKRIFEPFFTTKVVGKGTGLGLSVCLRVIKEHQGNILVESQESKGTKFTILLPNIVRRN